MMIRTLMAATAIALAATPSIAQIMAPGDYVATAGASDLYERRSSELVLQSTQDPAIRQFATMMIAHHTKSTKDVVAAARQARVKAPPLKLMPAQVTMVTELKAVKGSARDKAYVAQQRQAHDQALALHKAYAAEGTVPALRAAAGKVVTVVQRHIDMLSKM